MTRLSPLPRALAATLILAAVLFWANCDLVFRLERPDDTPSFMGCFLGQVTDPPDGGKLRILLEQVGAGNSVMLSGCLESNFGLAALSGAVEEDDSQRARFTAMPTSGSGAFTFRVIRQPGGNVIPTAIDFENINFSPFNAALGLPRCAPVDTVTCADLGVVLPFVPGGGLP